MRSFAMLAMSAMLVPSALALSLPPLGEYPDDWTCDADVRVCAGIEVGGAASCALTLNGSASCDFSYGHTSRAWGDDGEPGAASSLFHARVERCSSFAGCERLVDASATGECAWLPALSCEGGDSDEGEATTPPLALGECVTLQIFTTGSIDARVEGLFAPVAPDPASVHAEDASEDAAAVCRVDDGR